MFSRVSLASQREGVNTTLHRAHFTHANICSRVAQGSSARFCFFCVCFRMVIRHSRVSFLVRSHCGLLSPPFPLSHHVPISAVSPRTVLNPASHGQEDSLVDWLNDVLSQVMSPTSLSRRAVQRLQPCSYRQGEQVSVRRTLLVRTSQLFLCLETSMRD